jgi:HSP20 family protein
MFSLRPQSFFDFGFPRSSSFWSDPFLDDSFFEPVSSFEFVPVVYRPVNRRGARHAASANQSPKKRAAEPVERTEHTKEQTKEQATAPSTEATPEKSASADQQVAQRSASASSLSLPDSFTKPLDMSVKDEDARLVVTADLHGVPQDKIDLSIENGLLRLAATRLHEHKDGQSALRYQESLQRAVALPKGVDESQITATYQDGVLQVVVPKPENARRKRVQITAAPSKTTEAPAALTEKPVEANKCADAAQCKDKAACGACESPATAAASSA